MALRISHCTWPITISSCITCTDPISFSVTNWGKLCPRLGMGIYQSPFDIICPYCILYTITCLYRATYYFCNFPHKFSLYKIFSVLFWFSQCQSNSIKILSTYFNFKLAAKEYALVSCFILQNSIATLVYHIPSKCN